MTNYDRLIDTITTELFYYWQNGCNNKIWDEETAKKVSHKILTLVEKFQENPKKIKWRATD